MTMVTKIARDDDVFLTESPTYGTPIHNFDTFRSTHTLLCNHDVVHRIAIIASEIPHHPATADFIKANVQHFDFAVHGWTHAEYQKWRRPAWVQNSLSRAVAAIEDTFGVSPKVFVPPWNKLSPIVRQVCANLGLAIDESPFIGDIGNQRVDHVHFHSWNKKQVGMLREWLLRK